MYTSSVADPGSVKRGGRESKFLDAAPENRPKSAKKTKIGRKKGGGGRGRFGPYLDPPLIIMNW